MCRCWSAITRKQNLPDFPQNDDVFNRNVSFFEATSESIIQFTVGDVVIRTYGVSDDLITRIFQLFSLASSMFSLVVAFITVSMILFCLYTLVLKGVGTTMVLSFQRQSFLRPMVTPNLSEKSFKEVCKWLKWKIFYALYILCAALPIALCITCLMVLSISRRSTIILPAVMSMMLHPAIMAPIGLSSKIVEFYLSTKLFKTTASNTAYLIIRRILTYSINIHLASVASLMCFLFSFWSALQVTSSMDFNNKPFNQCSCDVLSENNLPCINKETENSFQNVFLAL